MIPAVARGTKIRSVLAALARGRSYNRFEAERELHDHVLPSTVQRIQKLGISVTRKHEVVPGHSGSRVRTVRFWLEPEEREKAAAILGAGHGT